MQQRVGRQDAYASDEVPQESPARQVVLGIHVSRVSGGSGSGRVGVRVLRAKGVPLGPRIMSPTAGGLVLVVWLQRLHVRAPERWKPQQVESIQVPRSTATSNARVDSSTTSPACVWAMWFMSPGTKRKTRLEHLVHQ